MDFSASPPPHQWICLLEKFPQKQINFDKESRERHSPETASLREDRPQGLLGSKINNLRIPAMAGEDGEISEVQDSGMKLKAKEEF